MEVMKSQEIRKSSAKPAKTKVESARRKGFAGLMRGTYQQGGGVQIQNEGKACKHHEESGTGSDNSNISRAFEYSPQTFPIYHPGLPVTPPPSNFMYP